MTVYIPVKRWMVYLVIVLLGILIGSQAAGLAPATALAQSAPSTVSEDGVGLLTNYVFEPANVAIFSNRIHVKCEVPNGSIGFFAYPLTDAKQANRILSLLLTAEAANDRIVVSYDASDTSGTAFGCQSGDCRTIQAIYLQD